MTVIVTTLSFVRMLPIEGVWVIIGLASQLSVTLINELKSVTTNSQLELKYSLTFTGQVNTGLMVSINVRLKKQLVKLPVPSVTVILIIVSEFTKEPTAGSWVNVGFESQLSEIKIMCGM